MKALLPFLLCFLLTSLFAQNAYPTISNLTVQIDEAEGIVTVTYDLADADDEDLEVSFLVSDDNGQSFTLGTENATGDVGFPVQPGLNKTITWDASGELSGARDYQVKLVADDLFEIDIQAIVDQVDSARLRSNLEFIAAVRHRNANPTHLEAVKDSIEQAFIAANLTTYRAGVPFGNYTGQNIIGDLEGTTEAESTYIIDAHFDTVSDSPGADDNGSGVVGMLEALSVLAPYRFNKSLRFIGFDLEEVGLVGANTYVSTGIPAEETIAGVFNLEMIGYYTEAPNSQTFPTGFELLYPAQAAEVEANQSRGDFITNIGDPNSVAIHTAYNNAAAQYVPELKVISFIAPTNWQVLTPDFGRSDHAPFWLRGIPALMLTDGSEFRNFNYHTPNDVVETLDFTFMSNVVKAVVGAVAEEAGIEHSTVATAEFSVVTRLNQVLDCQLELSPIPAAENLKLSFARCDFETLHLQLFDVTGKLVLESRVQPTLSSAIDLDVATLEAGIYVLKASHGTQSLSRRVVIQ